MDKIARALQKLSNEERSAVKEILKRIQDFNFQGLDIKKLQGRNDIFRARKGRIRVIYRLAKNKEIFILAIERRSEKTYRHLPPHQNATGGEPVNE